MIETFDRTRKGIATGAMPGKARIQRIPRPLK